jgi:hypothetical protein
MTTPTPATGDLQALNPRIAAAAALTAIVLSGLAGATLLALPRPHPVAAPTVPNLAEPAPRQLAIAAIGVTVASAEAYYTDHRTYKGITQSDLSSAFAGTVIPNAVFDRWLHSQTLFRYGVGFGFLIPGSPVAFGIGWEGHIYFASKHRYCVEFQRGLTAWSQNGPLAPLQRGLCRLRTLLQAPAPHDGMAPDLPLMPHQAPVPLALQEDEGVATTDPTQAQTAADALELRALQLNAYWVTHNGTYSGASRVLQATATHTTIVLARGNTYCIEARIRPGVTIVKKGPGAQLRISSKWGANACEHPTTRLPSQSL